MPASSVVKKYSSLRMRSAVPAPSSTPTRRRSRAASVMPESQTASSAALMPIWSERDRRRRSRREQADCTRGKSTSPASWLRYPDASKAETGRMPQTPASMFCQVSSRVGPNAVTRPIPVMATRRISRGPRQGSSWRDGSRAAVKPPPQCAVRAIWSLSQPRAE
jgi:hypothetical protein